MCLIPPKKIEISRYWQIQNEKVTNIYGIAPRRLPKVINQPRIPRITHVHVDQGPLPVYSEYELGIYGKNVLRRTHSFRLNNEYLKKRNLYDQNKVLVLAGKDPFLRELCYNINNNFFDSLNRTDITAIICPFLSDYQHSEHRVGLDNRAISQNFLDSLLKHGLPGIFFTYIDDSEEYLRWLIEFFKLNPTQHFIATGFDRGAASNKSFVIRRLEILKSVEEAIGRPLRVVLSSIMTRLPLIAAASDMFPGRVHLVAQSVYLLSVQGCSLEWVPASHLHRHERDERFAPGWELFEYNAQVLQTAIEMEIPKFVSSKEENNSVACQEVA